MFYMPQSLAFPGWQDTLLCALVKSYQQCASHGKQLLVQQVFSAPNTAGLARKLKHLVRIEFLSFLEDKDFLKHSIVTHSSSYVLGLIFHQKVLKNTRGVYYLLLSYVFMAMVAKGCRNNRNFK